MPMSLRSRRPEGGCPAAARRRGSWLEDPPGSINPSGSVAADIRSLSGLLQIVDNYRGQKKSRRSCDRLDDLQRYQVTSAAPLISVESLEVSRV